MMQKYRVLKYCSTRYSSTSVLQYLSTFRYFLYVYYCTLTALLRQVPQCDVARNVIYTRAIGLHAAIANHTASGSGLGSQCCWSWGLNSSSGTAPYSVQ